MSYTETTSRSWFGRLRDALVKILVGLVLLLVSCVLLFWNEGRAIETYRALSEGAGLVVDVAADRPDAANDGKLVHIHGPVTPGNTVADSQFAIAAEGAVGLSRSVEMYQWVEKSQSKTEKQLGGSEETVTTYTYEKQWRGKREPSEDFKQADGHQNPEMPVASENFAVDSGTVGGFTVTGERLAELGKTAPLRLSPEDAQRYADYFGTGRSVVAKDGGLYAGGNPASPAIGDLRISYQRADLKDASIVARQAGTALEPYAATNGHEIFLSASGEVSAPAMFKDAEDTNAIITWLLRVAGLFCMFIGFSMVFSIFSVVADIIPFVGSVVAFGTTTAALILTLLIGPFVIAIGWFAYRPLLALAILGIGAAVASLFWYLKRGRAVPPVAAAPSGQ